MFALEGLGFLAFAGSESGQPGSYHLKMNTAPCWAEATLRPKELRLRVKKRTR